MHLHFLLVKTSIFRLCVAIESQQNNGCNVHFTVGAALSRFVIGFFLVFATKSIVKEISKAIVSRRSAQQYASVKKTDKRPRPPKYSDNMAVLPMILRGLEYTGIGLAVIYSIAVFHYIGI